MAFTGGNFGVYRGALEGLPRGILGVCKIVHLVVSMNEGDPNIDIMLLNGVLGDYVGD